MLRTNGYCFMALTGPAEPHHPSGTAVPGRPFAMHPTNRHKV